MVHRAALWRLTRRLAFAVVIFITVLLSAGALYQFVATLSDEYKYPPPGQLVSVDGRSVHIYCTGEGQPTVILESGLGGGMLDWGLVQPEVAKFARVCSYDRAGIAWSGASGSMRDADHIVSELHRLLEITGTEPPYVLVGHSIGGVYSQLFASRFPDEVSGVVLVDSSHQDQLSRLPAIPAFMPYTLKATSPFGIPRIVNSLEDVPPLVGDEMRSRRAALYSSVSSVYANADEMAAVADSLSELRSSPMDLGSKPLVVLSRRLNDGSSPELEASWSALQADLLKHSSMGKHVIAEQSGHYIHFYQPELVIQAIRKVTQK